MGKRPAGQEPAECAVPVGAALGAPALRPRGSGRLARLLRRLRKAEAMQLPPPCTEQSRGAPAAALLGNGGSQSPGVGGGFQEGAGGLRLRLCAGGGRGRRQELVGFSPLHKSPWAEGAAAQRMLDEFQEEKPPPDQLPIRGDAPAPLMGPNLHFCREKARREQARSWSWLPEPLPRTFPIKELITERAAKLPVVVRAALAVCGLGGSLSFFFF